MRHNFYFFLVVTASASLLSNSGIARTRKVSRKMELEKKDPNETKKGLFDNKSPRINQAVAIGSSLEKSFVKDLNETISYLDSVASEQSRGSKVRFKLLEKKLSLHVEQAAYVSSQEQKLYQRKIERKSKEERDSDRIKINNAVSRSHWTSAEVLSGQMLSEFANTKGLERILFKRGLALQYLGRGGAAVSTFETILRQYPKSFLIPDTKFALGEYYFGVGDFRRAKKFYTDTIRLKKKKWKGWSLFKAGWCDYSLGNFSSALSYWRKSFSFARNAGGKTGRLLKKEILNDIVLAFGSLGLIDEGLQFYQTYGKGSDLRKILQNMGYLADERGEIEKAKRAWKLLISRYPKSMEALEAQRALVAALFARSKYRDLWEELDKLVLNFGSRSAWKTGKEPGLVRDVDASIEKMMAYYPKVLHRTAEKEKKPRLYGQAETGYKLFLKRLPTSKYVPELREYLGDLYYLKKNYNEAGELYLSIVELGPKSAVVFSPRGGPVRNIHRRVADYMLDAFEKAVPKLKKGAIDPKRGIPQFRALDKGAINLERGCRLFRKWYPNDTKINRSCAARVASLFFEYGHKDRAVGALTLLVKNHPGTKAAKNAIETVIPMIKDDPIALASFGNEVLKKPVYAKSPIGMKVKRLLRGIQIDLIKKEKPSSKRGSLFEKQALAAPNDPNAASLWYRAASDHLSGGNVQRAIRAYKKIDQSYSSSSVHEESLFELGKLLRATFKLSEAAQVFARFGKKYSKSKRQRTAIEQSCYLAMSDRFQSASRFCFEYYQKFGTKSLAMLNRLIERASYAGQSPLIADVIDRVSRGGQTSVAQFELKARCSQVRSLLPARNEGLESRIVEISRGVSLDTQTARCLARIYLKRGEALWINLMKKRLIGGSISSLQASIQGMLQGIDALEKKYMRVLETKDPYYGIGAYARLSGVYLNFFSMMENPPSVKEAKKSELVTQLQGSVAQIKAKCREYVETAQSIADKHQVLGPFVGEISSIKKSLGGSTRPGLAASFPALVQTFAPSHLSR